MKNRRGISEVVTTLIFILLAIIAIGIVWYIFGNLSDQTQEQIDINSRCIGMDVRPTEVTSCAGGADTTCTVTVTRGPGNSEDIDGLRFVIIGASSSESVDVDLELPVSGSVTRDVTYAPGTTGVPATVTVTPYFDSPEGNQPCPSGQSMDA